MRDYETGLTQEKLKEILHYDPDTGFLTFKHTFRNYNEGDILESKVITLFNKKITKLHIIYLLKTGSLPKKRVLFKDNDKNNYRWYNIDGEPKKLTQCVLKNKLYYDPDTGVFTRLKNNKVAGYSWNDGRHSTDAIIIKVHSVGYYAHRLAFLYMNGNWPTYVVDHIDGNRTNNKWSNLRDVPQSLNCKNQKVRKSNKSGVTGVCWDKRSNKWNTYISNKYIGCFEEFHDAVVARRKAEKKYGYHPNHGRRTAKV